MSDSGNDWLSGGDAPFGAFDPYGVGYLGRPTIIETGPLPIRIYATTTRQYAVGASHIHDARLLAGMVPLIQGEAGYQRFRRRFPDGTVIIVTANQTVDGAPPVLVADILPLDEGGQRMREYFERQRAPFLWVSYRVIERPMIQTEEGEEEPAVQSIALCGWEPEWEDGSHQFIGRKAAPEGYYDDDWSYMRTDLLRSNWQEFFQYKPPLYSGPSIDDPHMRYGTDGGLYINDVLPTDEEGAEYYDPDPDEHEWEPGIMLDPIQGFGFTTPPSDGYPPEARQFIDETTPFNGERWAWQFAMQMHPRDRRDIWNTILGDGENADENKLVCIGKPKKKLQGSPWYLFKFHFAGEDPDSIGNSLYWPTYFGDNPHTPWKVQVKVVAGKYLQSVTRIFDLEIKASMHGYAGHQFWPGRYECTRTDDIGSVTDRGVNTGACYDPHTIEVNPWGAVTVHRDNSLRPWGI